ncbi:HK97-gp10 family putative phage morphogenesis protein [Komagataeibacter intermedius]|uniref:Uncharacterized protein n=1 Tax=Komagataeibacter intermedius NRIC 0521 TaxID=1307934 RepID=A0ABQ0PGL3_9PROT|nr:hypothetical protein [Komagataeibacter intermedius]GAN86346.1 hypothetical protein Gain_0027_021 [Komagataeibacter intermedius TF2]GBQ67915.1 hypothetical protein AA0521_1104 [Komagataeibacter intermedius NRIC 0521]
MAVNFNGGSKLKAALNKLSQKVKDGGHVRVGYLEGAKYDDEKHTPVAQVAAWDEFGTPTAPPRPFMRDTIAKHSDQWGDGLGKALKATDYDVNRALAGVGSIIVGQIIDQIDEGSYQPNAPLTNLLKDRFPKGDYSTEDFLKAVHDLKNGADAPEGTPLNWSDRMRNSTAYEVKDGPDES